MVHKGKTGSKESDPDKALEYYKLYSDNNKLPKYFCGTYETNNPSTSTNVPTVNYNEIYGAKKSLNVPTINYAGVFGDAMNDPAEFSDKEKDASSDKGREPSPTSSVASNRKLEWDNGADIGYDNCANKSLLHKSLSLPILTTYDEQGSSTSSDKGSPDGDRKSTGGKFSCEFQKRYGRDGWVDEGSDGRTKSADETLSGDKKSSIEILCNVNVTTTESSGASSGKKSTSSDDSRKRHVMNYIRAKVGIPIAESTPLGRLEITKPVCFEIKRNSSTVAKLQQDTTGVVKSITKSLGSGGKLGSEKSTLEIANQQNFKESGEFRCASQNADDQVLKKSGELNADIPKLKKLGDFRFAPQNADEVKSSKNSGESLYTPRVLKEKQLNSQNMRTLFEQAESCGKSVQANLSANSFYFEVKSASPHDEVENAATVSVSSSPGISSLSQGLSLHPSSSSPGMSLHPSSRLESVTTDTPVATATNSTTTDDGKSKILSSPENLTSNTNETVMKWSSQQDLTLPHRIKYFRRYRDGKVKKLEVTKPTYVECFGPESKNKNIQTSSENVSIGIQTETCARVPKTSEKNQQSVLYMFHPYNDRYNTNSTTQTDSDVVFSNCNSFEFLNGSECNKISNSETGKSDEAVNDYPSKKLKRATVKTDLTNLTDNSSSSKEHYLSDLLSQQVSGDVEKKLELLQKLYKSKKYDKETKKYYVRRILKSILNNYSEDSSLYSDKITPNIATNIPPRDRAIYGNASSENKTDSSRANQYINAENKQSYKTDSSREHQYINTYDEKQSYKDNHTDIYNGNKRQTDNDAIQNESSRGTFHDKRDKSEIIREGTYTGIARVRTYMDNNRHSRENQLQTNVPWVPIAPQNSCETGKSDANSKSTKVNSNTKPRGGYKWTDATPEPSSSSKDLRNATSSPEDDWKENKTVSERILELRNRKLSSGDTPETPSDELLHFAKRERVNQITWINNEIEHLVKLKSLLETKGREKTQPVKLADPKQKFEDEENEASKQKCENDARKISSKTKLANDLMMPAQGVEKDVRNGKKLASKKSTAIYMITTERASGDSNDVPVQSAVIRNSDVSRTRFLVHNDKGTTAYKVHELQTQMTESGDFAKPVDPYSETKNNKIFEEPIGDGNALDHPDDAKGAGRKLRCRPISCDSESSEHESIIVEPSSPVRTQCCEEWKRNPANDLTDNYTSRRAYKAKLCQRESIIVESSSLVRTQDYEELKSNPANDLIDDNTSKKSYKAKHPPEASNGTKINYSNAVLISNTVRPSQTNPADSVRRLILEIPIDSMVVQTQVNDEELNSKFVQTSKSLLDQASVSVSQSSSLSSSSGSSSSSCTNSSVVLCSCCRKLINNSDSSIAINSEMLQNNVRPPKFCDPCLAESQKKKWNPENPYFKQPQHQCNCRNNMDPDSINKIRTTLKELQELEAQENYCRCISSKLSKESESVCKGCNFKVKQLKSSKKPLAYLLTFEPGEYESPKRKHRDKSLEEIRVKIPGTKVRRKKSEERRMEEKGDRHKKNKHVRHKLKKSLQEYLESNNPTFVKAAEERRKCMIDLAYMREERCQKYKQLLALTNGIPMQKSQYSEIHQKRIFTSKEMKSMTAKKYKKLPEVQQKLVENRNKQIKKANRLLADIFNKKLREHVLMGNPTIPASTSVINLM